MKASVKTAAQTAATAKMPAPVRDSEQVDAKPLGGPVGAMQAELEARLSGAEYQSWLLPVEPRSTGERIIHTLSLAAGVLALTAGAAVIWFAVLSPALG